MISSRRLQCSRALQHFRPPSMAPPRTLDPRRQVLAVLVGQGGDGGRCRESQGPAGGVPLGEISVVSSSPALSSSARSVPFMPSSSPAATATAAAAVLGDCAPTAVLWAAPEGVSLAEILVTYSSPSWSSSARFVTFRPSSSSSCCCRCCHTLLLVVAIVQ